MKTKTLIWMLAAWLAVLMLAGCKTKTVTEYVSFHDTLRISKTDTNHNGVIDPWERIKACPCFDAMVEYKDI